jgi:hypothetical protein
MVSIYAGPDASHLQICGILSCTREQAERIIALLDPHDYAEVPWDQRGTPPTGQYSHVSPAPTQTGRGFSDGERWNVPGRF